MPEEAEENPESQNGPFCKGYWLRSPYGNGMEEDNEKVYIVDLVNGNIHPEKRKPDEATGENYGGNQNGEQTEEWKATSSIGIRPVFVLPQQG